jgi:hypothetical protein
MHNSLDFELDREGIHPSGGGAFGGGALKTDCLTVLLLRGGVGWTRVLLTDDRGHPAMGRLPPPPRGAIEHN